MIHLHYSNRLENLIDPLVQSIAQRQRRDPLERIAIIVPNRAVEDFVKLGVAERLGVAANLSFPFLRAYLGAMAVSARPELRVLEVPQLQLVLFECLRSRRHRDDPELAPVRDWLNSARGTAPGQAELALFELCEKLARLFQEYSLSRASMLRRWHKGTTLAEAPFAATERWQRHLWCAAFEPGGAARREWTGDARQRWMLLPDAIAAAPDSDLKRALPPALAIFGLSSPGQIFAQIFARLGNFTELSIYALNPCMEFWGDLDTSRGTWRDSWARRGQRLGAALESSEDPFGLAAPAENPALRNWGRPGREYIRLFNELTDCDFDPHFSQADGEGGDCTLLACLQDDVLARAAPAAPRAKAVESPPTIRVLACPQLRREVEIVASEIWRLIRAADGGGPSRLRLHQIGVLVPDASAGIYLTQIETVFSSQHGIPVEIAGRRTIRESRVAEAIALLLELPLGQLTREELVRILRHPAISGGDSAVDVEQWAAWCDDAGVFFGADASELEHTYVPPALFHWDQALSRLALGAFLASDDGGDARLYRSRDGAEYLPLDIGGAEPESAAKLLRIARALISDAREIASKRMHLDEWSVLLAELIKRHVLAADPADLRVRDRCLGAIAEIGEGGIAGGPVPYEIARQAVAARIADVESAGGSFFGRGVAAGSLGTLHSLPFRVIFVLGLGEAIFPERERRDPLDLRQARRRAGDVSAAERDRYFFLESLLAARERIFLSYVARDSHTGDALEPSTVVRELESILEGYLDRESVARLTVTHPGSRYDLRYFSDLARAAGLEARVADDELISFDSAARRGARMAALRSSLECGAGDRPLPAGSRLLESLAPTVRERLRATLGEIDLGAGAAAVRDEIALPLSAIRRFLECPLQGAARYALGMLDDEEPAEESGDEPLEQSRLDRAILLRGVYWRLRGATETFDEEYRRAVEIAQMKGRAPAGPFADAAAAADSAQYIEWCRQAKAAGAGDLRQWREIRIGRGDEHAQADLVLPALTLDVPVGAGGATVRRVNLYGSIGAVAPGLDMALACVMRAKPQPRDFLGPFVNAIALAASGAPVAKKFRAIVAGAPPDKPNARGAPPWIRTLATPSRDEARAYLGGLIAEMLSRAHDYFLPIEAVAAVRHATSKHGRDADVIGAVEQIRERERPTVRSDYGPIRNARRFNPPPPDEIQEIIARRFGLLAAIFDEAQP
jgi:exodeoxyribonuclease V gamma subunit